jgi:putative acyl-CoA dehydrogenase
MPELRARYLAERMALAMQAATLIRNAPNFVADAFCMTRLGERGGKAFGTLPTSVDMGAIIDRAYPG